MKKQVNKVTPVLVQASKEESDHDMYLHGKVAGIPPDTEYWCVVEECGMDMFESAPYAVKCEAVMKMFTHALKNQPDKVLRDMLAAMNSDSFSMAEFSWDFAKDYLADLLFIPGKKANAARMR